MSWKSNTIVRTWEPYTPAESAEWCPASSSLTKCSSVWCKTIKILRNLLKSSISLPIALLKSKEHICQCRKTQLCRRSPEVWFIYIATLQLGLCSLVKDCLQWLFLSLVAVNPKLFSCTAEGLSSLEYPLHLVLRYQCLPCFYTPVACYKNSEGLDQRAWCSWSPQELFQPPAFFPKLSS